MSMKPSDRWTISLCKDCHANQHRLGEPMFELITGINMRALAEAFVKASPHRGKLNA